MSPLRDYDAWHRAYDDPNSGLSWRLRTVQGWIADALDDHPGPLRAISVCAGDGRDLLGVLSGRDDADRVGAALIEVDDVIAGRAERNAAECGAAIEVRRADAGISDSYRDLGPAELVLLVGIFGNISDDDIRTTISWAPRLCAPGADLLWSRGRDGGDLNPQIRDWFGAAGFAELDYAERNAGTRPALGRMRYVGEPAGPVRPGQRLFTFIR
jgi:hypothetical protein